MITPPVAPDGSQEPTRLPPRAKSEVGRAKPTGRNLRRDINIRSLTPYSDLYFVSFVYVYQLAAFKRSNTSLAKAAAFLGSERSCIFCSSWAALLSRIASSTALGKSPSRACSSLLLAS